MSRSGGFLRHSSIAFAPLSTETMFWKPAACRVIWRNAMLDSTSSTMRMRDCSVTWQSGSTLFPSFDELTDLSNKLAHVERFRDVAVSALGHDAIDPSGGCIGAHHQDGHGLCPRVCLKLG